MYKHINILLLNYKKSILLIPKRCKIKTLITVKIVFFYVYVSDYAQVSFIAN